MGKPRDRYNLREERYKWLKKPVLISFFAAVALFGFIISKFAVDDYRNALVSSTWHIAEATALGDGREGVMRIMGGEYAYYAQGRTYHGRSVRFFVNNRLLNPSPPKSFKAAEQFTVYVNPINPKHTVIVTGASGIGFMIILLVGAIVFFVGLGGMARISMTRG